MFDKKDYLSYQLAKPDTEYAFNSINDLKKENHIIKFYKKVFS